MGLTFKENCPDLRNSKVVDIVRELQDYGAIVEVHDPWVDGAEARHEYGIRPVKTLERSRYDAAIMAVGHKQFREMGAQAVRRLCRKTHVLYDIKYVFKAAETDGRL
jgi:UDP-N-acetyl-D-galactosamine dehydrogenase